MSPSRTPAYPDRRFTFHDVLDPRWLQLGFALTFLFSMGLLALGGSRLALDSILGAATTLCVVVTVVVLVLPWRRLPRVVSGVVPVLDIAALGLSRWTLQDGRSRPCSYCPCCGWRAPSTASGRWSQGWRRHSSSGFRARSTWASAEGPSRGPCWYLWR